ncbi:MAG: hypothetical protein ACK587_03300 [Cyanobacteriota bacterium]
MGFAVKKDKVPNRQLPLFLGCTLLFISSPDQTKADPYRFQTPLRNIFCQLDSRGLSCDLITFLGTRRDEKCQQENCNELRFFLPPTGKAFALPRSDSMAFSTKRTISAGMRLRTGSITCLIENDGLFCKNISNGSLLLKRFGYALNTQPQR